MRITLSCIQYIERLTSPIHAGIDTLLVATVLALSPVGDGYLAGLVVFADKRETVAGVPQKKRLQPSTCNACNNPTRTAVDLL